MTGTTFSEKRGAERRKNVGASALEREGLLSLSVRSVAANLRW
jgi:hypothetical protein